MTEREIAKSASVDPTDAVAQHGYVWFTFGVGSWFGSFGLQQVLFSWIVVGELASSSEWVGFAQTASMLPSLVLLIFGGAVADRFDPRRLLVGLHIAAALPTLALAVASRMQLLSLPMLVAYGLAMGTVTAFAFPARDALLSRVAGADMMRAVSGMTATQFGSQAAGSLLAAAARFTGSTPMLLVQALVMLSGSLAMRGVPAKETDVARAAEPFSVRDLGQGVAEVARTPRLRAPLVLAAAVGVLFVGPFLVVFPLLVRDHYRAGVDALSIVLTLFPLGTISGSLVMRRFGVPHKGWALIVALWMGSLFLALVGLEVPFLAMLVLIFCWGLSASVFINASRTLFQEAAPPEHRGRVLAIYQLAFMGGGPVGAFSAGLLISEVGLHATLLAAAAVMVTITVLMAMLSGLRGMD